jgi:hypothetical protein
MTSKILIPKSAAGGGYEIIVEPVTKGTPGRKRKLDHLSPDEKIQRKKLKNRVAAQTSRDRKKKLFDELERKLDQQARQMSALEKRCNQLQSKCEKLERENKKLKSERGSVPAPTRYHNIPEEHRYTRILAPNAEVDSIVGSLIIKSEPAVFNAPLPKVIKMKSESTIQSTLRRDNNSQKKADVRTLLKIILLCLLYKNSFKVSTSMTSTWSNLQRACSKMSPQSWKKMLEQAALQMPKMKAQNAHALDQWWGPKTKQWSPPKIAA